jgi:hypothetical protein
MAENQVIVIVFENTGLLTAHLAVGQGKFLNALAIGAHEGRLTHHRQRAQ